MKTIIGILAGLILLPIRFYLMWYILTSIGATELPMFIFWFSLPFAILVGILSEVAKNNK